MRECCTWRGRAWRDLLAKAELIVLAAGLGALALDEEDLGFALLVAGRTEGAGGIVAPVGHPLVVEVFGVMDDFDHAFLRAFGWIDVGRREEDDAEGEGFGGGVASTFEIGLGEEGLGKSGQEGEEESEDGAGIHD